MRYRSFRLRGGDWPFWCHPLLAIVLVISGILSMPSPDEVSPLQRLLPWVWITIGLSIAICWLVVKKR